MIRKGSVIAVNTEKYVDFPGGSWASHFVLCRRLLLARSMPSNNGNFRAVDSSGRLHWLHDSEIAEIVRL